MAKEDKEKLKLEQEYRKAVEQSNLSARERVGILSDLNKLSKQDLQNTIALLKEEKKLATQKAKSAKAQEAADAKAEAAKQKQIDLQNKISDLEGKQIDIAKKLQGDLVKNKAQFDGIAKASRDNGRNLIAAYKEQLKTLDLRTKQGRSAKQELDTLIQQVNEQNQIADGLEKISKSPLAPIFQEASDLASEVAGKVQGIFSSLPGGNALFKALGGEDLEEQLQKGVSSGFAAMAKSMGEGKGMVASLKDGMSAFSGVVKGIPNIGMILGIGGAIVLAKTLFAVFQSISGEAKELAKETGITYTEAKRLNAEARKAQASFDNQLATMEDITAVQSELVKGFGSAALVSTEVAANVADTAKAFGVSAETAGQVTKELTMMGMSQQEAADLQLETNAAALKAGVNVAAVQEDIAKNAQTAAAYFGGSGKELAKAAVEAAKMGVSIEQMVKTADGLLDIESSLEKQFRAQALTGKNLNFEKARQLALDGKIEEAQAEMLRQAGTIDEFNAMAPHQRKALAEAMGMEVGELQKSLTLQKMRGKLSKDELAAANGLNLSAEELANMDADQIKAELAKKNAADKTAAAFQKIKNDLVTALAPAAEAFAGIISGLTPVIQIIGKALKIAFLPVTLAGKAMQAFADAGIVVKGIVAAIGFGLLSNYLMSKNITAEGVTQGIQDKVKLVKTKAMNVLRAIGLGTEGGITKEKIAQKVQEAISFAKQTAINALKVVQLGLQTAYNLAISAGNALMSGGIGGILKQAGAFLMKAVSGIFATLSQIPFGAGLLLAGGAIAGMFALFNKAKSEKAGDVGIAPKGGPIVASPQEGRIFQGSTNDGVEMSPTAGTPGGGGGGGSTTATISSDQMKQIVEALQQIVQGVQNPPPVVIGESQVSSIGSKISAAKSFIS